MSLIGRDEIARLKGNYKECDELYKKTYQLSELTTCEKEHIRFLLRQRMTEIDTKIRQTKRQIKENETIQRLSVGQVYEHEFFEDEVEITNIYTEGSKIMVETRFRGKTFDSTKTSTHEYDALIKRFNGNYVLVKE